MNLTKLRALSGLHQKMSYLRECSEHYTLIVMRSLNLERPPNYVVDHQGLKDRLGSIVRAKEGCVLFRTPRSDNT